MTIMLFKGYSPHHLKKFKKSLKEKENLIRSLDYTIYAGFKRIDLQIEEIKKKGFNEVNVRNVLSKELNRLSEQRKILEIEFENLNKYIYDDMKRIELKKDKKRGI